MKVLAKKGITEPILILHPMAKMTTPWDVYENRMCDDNIDHGTCGLGVGKTMARDAQNYKINAIDLLHLPILKEKIKKLIERSWSPANHPLWLLQEIIEFWAAIDYIDWAVADYSFLEGYDTLIFEGSQGVLLDKDHGVFPNVTYANTTSKNAMEVCNELNIKNRHIYCVTRSYHTRHGTGMFLRGEIKLRDTQHETNVNNEYQGYFKVAPLDYSLLDYAAAIETLYSMGYKQTLMVTCCGQVYKEDKFKASILNSKWFNIKRSYSPYGEFKNY